MKKINFHDLIKTRKDGILFYRERHNLEFKKDFQFKSMAKYLKTIAAFANNKGGVIVFGISDSPRKLLGMENNQFDTIDSGKITEYLSKHFDPEIHWEMNQIEIEQKK
ncbi:MAG TPA: hypothetical protein DHU26_10530 [Spirochaetaceae bacterium]|nr:hypothetical protein [Spirochaetaceae bacterium]